MNNNNNHFFDRLMMTQLLEEDNEEIIEILANEETPEIENDEISDELKILPLRNAVLFPGVIIPVTVGRKKSVKLVKKVYDSDRLLGVVAQKSVDVDEPESQDLYNVGTVAKIIKLMVLPDGNTTIIIQGKSRFKIEELKSTEEGFSATINLLKEKFPSERSKEVKAIMKSLKDAASKILQLSPEIPQEAQIALDNINSPAFLVHFLCSNLNVDVKDKQRLLEVNDGKKRATVLLEYMLKEVQMLEIKNEIQQKVHSDIDQQQRDFYLRQQMKVLQDELGQEGPDQEIEDLRMRAISKDWPEDIQKHFLKELDKVQRMNPAAAEFPVTMNYVELLIDLPWNEFSEDNFDLKRASKILDKDHYGLDKVKERILEYLAVRKLKNDMRGPILCLYGPPGVGKTSLGKSVAEALGRKYVRMSLGGLHDESEIRGHRKTYVGAMPGKVIQNIKKAKAANPVFILDEIDKVSSDFRGDPASALLEVLDPEQNNSFQDNYLEVEYDLSNVLFIATANSLDTIHPALRDRMEIIEITGYTLEEKLEIAKKHLIPKQRNEHGLKSKDFTISKTGLVKIIEGYTRESGVRNLERKISSIVRYVAKSIAMEEEYTKTINPDMVIKILGAEIFDKELYQDNNIAGVVTGLAWTPTGGDILFIESSLSKGKGKLILSGQLGDVMKESAMTALSILKTKSDELGIDMRIFDQYDLHVHVPAGAVPKDGPSAGITMLTSLASVYTQRKVRPKLAMTGEVTLRGKVLPVGGIREKLLAAKRAGINQIIMSERNRRDVEEMKEDYLKNLKIKYVSDVEEVLDFALLDQKVKKPIQFQLREEKDQILERLN